MSERVNYQRLSLSQVQHRAAIQARGYGTPRKLMHGREQRNAFAIDTAAPHERDDAINVSRTREGHMLHVSVVDVGVQTESLPAVVELARRNRETKYYGDHTASMIPKILSENKWSFVRNAPRLALTAHLPITEEGWTGEVSLTRDVVEAKCLNYGQVDAMNEAEAARLQLPIRALGRVARSLYAQRHGGSEDYRLETEEGRRREGQFALSKFAVQESSIVLNRAMAMFFDEHFVSGIYRKFGLSTELQEHVASGKLDRDEAMRFARASYVAYPATHAAMNGELYMHFSAPLRRLPALYNHINLAHFLDGKLDKYNTAALKSIEKDYAARRPSSQAEGMALRAGGLEGRIQSDTINEAEMSHLFFGIVNASPEEVIDLRQKAFAALLGKKGLGKNVVETAQMKGLLFPGPEHDVLIDADGQLMPHYLYDGIQRAEANVRALILLSHRTGSPMTRPDVVRAMRASRSA